MGGDEGKMLVFGEKKCVFGQRHIGDFDSP